MYDFRTIMQTNIPPLNDNGFSAFPKSGISRSWKKRDYCISFHTIALFSQYACIITIINGMSLIAFPICFCFPCSWLSHSLESKKENISFLSYYLCKNIQLSTATTRSTDLWFQAIQLHFHFAIHTPTYNPLFVLLLAC